MSEDKLAARQSAFRTRKAAYSKDRVSQAARMLVEVLEGFPGRSVAGYLPIRTEADPRPAMSKAGLTVDVGVPVVVARNTPLVFRCWSLDTKLIEGAFGVMIPEDTTLMVPQVVIVPMLAFDTHGYRLGYGGGYYDRTLEQLRKTGGVIALGLAFDAQAVDKLPVEPTDQPLDGVVTESGYRTF